MIVQKLRLVSRFQSYIIVRNASFFSKLLKPERNTPPYSHCVQIGDPVLREVADPVPPELITSPEVQFLVKSLEKTLKDYSLVGIASPQVGISLRIFLMSVSDVAKEKQTPEAWKAKEMQLFPLTVFINPEIEILDHKKVIFEESCASIVGFAAEVARNYSVKVKALNAQGEPTEHIFTGWLARIAQHENDHLNGVMFTDIMNRKSLRCTNWQSVNSHGGRLSVPYYPK